MSELRFASLREDVCVANRRIDEAGLAQMSFGNASGADRAAGVMSIKPSGIACGQLRADDVVTVSLSTGALIAGFLRPSSDTPTHLVLYDAFPRVGGVVHTHSRWATIWAQAQREIPCLGTTHADHFRGPVPVTRQLTAAEISKGYERSTGAVIAERFAGTLDPAEIPAVLVAGHGPFAWGVTVTEAVENAMALELIAEMALRTLLLEPEVPGIPRDLLDKHFLRKHGPDAYYGQRPGPLPGRRERHRR